MFARTQFGKLPLGTLFVTNSVEPGQPPIFGKAVLWVRTNRNAGTSIISHGVCVCRFEFENEVYEVDGQQAESTLLLQFTPEDPKNQKTKEQKK